MSIPDAKELNDISAGGAAGGVISSTITEEDVRVIHINDSSQERNISYGYPDNSIKTSRYNLLTFIPLNLFHQFKRIANFYYLFIVLIQLIPGISPFKWWTLTPPLIFILTVSAIKDAVEDFVSFAQNSLLF
jgi:hypothetical protein